MACPLPSLLLLLPPWGGLRAAAPRPRTASVAQVHPSLTARPPATSLNNTARCQAYDAYFAQHQADLEASLGAATAAATASGAGPAAQGLTVEHCETLIGELRSLRAAKAIADDASDMVTGQAEALLAARGELMQQIGAVRARVRATLSWLLGASL